MPGFVDPPPWDEERKMWMKIRAAAPEWPMFLTAFGVCLLMFLQLRIAAEFKDAVEDARWRSCRPVPRGVFILAAVIQLVLVFALDSRLWVVLALAWSYLALLATFGTTAMAATAIGFAIPVMASLGVVLALAAIQAARSLARKSKPSPRSGRSRSI